MAPVSYTHLDQETTDFYRWKVEYTQEELSALILKRSGIDYGPIIDLIPIARGTSGRLWKLKIVGTKRTLTIGKELEIRRTLSTSHLYSSAFVVDKMCIRDRNGFMGQPPCNCRRSRQEICDGSTEI